jgi:5-methylcytosine-specific restriction endonuclease McrA
MGEQAFIGAGCLMVWLLVLCFSSFTKWQRKDIFKRDNATCQGCGRKWDEGYMLECHHVNPLNCGGDNSISNGRLLCRSCHAEAHRILATNADTAKQRHANAAAYRVILKRIEQKGLKRYGY